MWYSLKSSNRKSLSRNYNDPRSSKLRLVYDEATPSGLIRIRLFSKVCSPWRRVKGATKILRIGLLAVLLFALFLAREQILFPFWICRQLLLTVGGIFG